MRAIHGECLVMARRCGSSSLRDFPQLGGKRLCDSSISSSAHDPQRSQVQCLDTLFRLDDHARRFEGVLHWNGAEILDWYLAAAKAAKTGFAA